MGNYPKPLKKISDLKGGCAYFEVGVDAFDRLYLGRIFVVKGQSFFYIAPASKDKYLAVRARWVGGLFENDETFFLDGHGLENTCGNDVMQHRIFNFQGNNYKVMKKMIAEQDVDAYFKMTGQERL